MVIHLWLACATPPEGPPATTGTPTTPEAVVAMDPARVAIRASLDLRGVRPSIEEFDRVAADPAAVDELVEEWLHDLRFGSRMADLWSEVYLTRSEAAYYVGPDDYGLYDVSGADFLHSVGDQPLRMLARIADEDRPWTELVTADWTLADPLLGQIWPLEREEGDGWTEARWTDARPDAGVLSSNTLWWRYTSTDSNANRKRANQISRIFLCEDYLVRPIEFDRALDLLDEEAVLTALQTNPACLNCHASLDPLAGYLYGFWYYDYYSVADLTEYHPERELQWGDQTGVPPGYFGSPGFTLKDLGRQLAADNRFAECAVEQATHLLLGRDLVLDDTGRLVQHREAFIQGGATLRALVRSVIASPEYRAGDVDDAVSVPWKLASADLLASQIEDLTGFRWTTDGYDLLQSADVGFRTLAGGADGYYATKGATLPNATLVLTHERLAEAAAAYVAATDLALDPTERRLLVDVDAAETSGSAPSSVRQLQTLHLRLFGKRVAETDPEVVELAALYDDVFAIQQDPTSAWAAVVSALLRDPDLLLY